MRYILNNILFIVNIGIGLLTILAYCSPYINPSKFWIFSLLSLFFPILLISHIIFLIWWAFTKPKWMLISCICLLLGWNHIKGFYNFGSQEAQQSTKPQLKIISQNVSNALYGYDKKKKNREEKKEVFATFLDKHQNTDIFCFQEVAYEALGVIKKTIPKHYIYQVNSTGTIIVSKSKILKKGQIDFGTITNGCLWADIIHKGDTIRFYSFHLQSNRISNDAEKLANDTIVDSKKAWYDIKSILRKYRHHHIQRVKQVKLILEHASQCKHHVVLCGDLNDPSLTYTYRQLGKSYSDMFLSIGSGLGTTFDGIIPLLRIDYIFLSKDITAEDFDIEPTTYSDHHALVSHIRFKD